MAGYLKEAGDYLLFTWTVGLAEKRQANLSRVLVLILLAEAGRHVIS